jgi:diguanylate cyclase (GGDEF)-like protein
MADAADIRDVLAKIDAVIGMGAAIGGYRRDMPDENQERQYALLVREIEQKLASFRGEYNLPLTNPNQHPTLRGLWAWVWGFDGDRDRKAAPRMMYTPLINELTTLAEDAVDPTDLKVGTKEQFQPALQRELQTGQATSLVFVDLDGFKSVNDTRGHQIGDQCIAAMAETIRACVVGKGVVFRNGGDEFVAVLRNSTQAEAAAVAERIRAAVEATGAQYNVTASIGVAGSDVFPVDDATLTGIADEAMYVSKNGGKNKVTVAAQRAQ